MFPPGSAPAARWCRTPRAPGPPPGSCSQRLVEVEGSLVRVGVDHREAVAAVEPLRVDVALVAVDLDGVDSTVPGRGQQQVDDARADSLAASVGPPVDLRSAEHTS